MLALLEKSGWLARVSSSLGKSDICHVHIVRSRELRCEIKSRSLSRYLSIAF